MAYNQRDRIDNEQLRIEAIVLHDGHSMHCIVCIAYVSR